MTQTTNRFLDELAKLLTDAAGAAQGMRREFETLMRSQGERILREMDVVQREEFEAVKEMAAKAREENEQLSRTRRRRWRRRSRALRRPESVRGADAIFPQAVQQRPRFRQLPVLPRRPFWPWTMRAVALATATRFDYDITWPRSRG